MYIAGGCFWGMQELMRKQPGVIETEVGYTGGKNTNPSYSFHPGHAEALRLVYDPNQTSFKALLEYFFIIHDPTTLNQQGNDIGSSYRSAIFVENDEQRNIAQGVINGVNTSGKWESEVVTNIEDLDVFYPAEDEHQDYLQRHPGGYTCHFERH